MAIVAGDFVQVLHEGSNDITAYVVSYRRYSSLCEIGDTFEMVLSPDLDVTLSPYDDIRITEWYDGDSGVILRGYVLSINQDYNGAYVIQGQDKSVLLFDYFIPTQIKSQGESVDFWIQYYADQAGLDIEFQANSANAVVAPDTLMGMQSAGQGILTMERLAAYYIRFDSSANKLVAYRLGSSQPVITIDDVVEGRRLKGTEKTRNVVRVYGGYRYSFNFADPPELLTAVARTDIPELLVDKTVVVASPGLQKQSYLDIVADRILNTVNSIDDVHFYSLPVFVPNIDVGEIAYLNVNHPPHISYAGERKISSIEASFDQSGAMTTIGIGEKCPRISIQFPTPPVYATTTEDGVAVSWNAGNSFVPSNTGLTGSGLIGKNIGVNSYGKQMVLTAAGIFRRPSTAFSWTFVDDTSTLPAPINTSNDQPSGIITASGLNLIRIVDEPTNIDTFHFLANGEAPSGGFRRSWVYTTKDFGGSWSSHQLHVPAPSGTFKEHIDAPPGQIYDVYGHDLFGGVDNNVFALVTSEKALDQIPLTFYAGNRDGTGNSKIGIYDITDGDESYSWEFEFDITPNTARNNSMVYSLPKDRTVAYYITLLAPSSDDSPERIVVHRTVDSGENWTKIHDVDWFTDNTYDIYHDSEIYFDVSGDRDEVNIVIINVMSDNQGVGGSSVEWNARFIQDDISGASTTYVDRTINTSLAGVKDQQTIKKSNWPSCRTSFEDGPNSAYHVLFSAEGVPDLVSDFEDTSTTMHQMVCKAYFPTQTISILNTVSFEAVNNRAWQEMDGHAWTSKEANQVFVTISETKNNIPSNFDPDFPRHHFYTITDTGNTLISTVNNASDGNRSYPHTAITNPEPVFLRNDDVWSDDGSTVTRTGDNPDFTTQEFYWNQGRFTSDYYSINTVPRFYRHTEGGAVVTLLYNGFSVLQGSRSVWDFRTFV
ncbi:hypothetical protein LCGC14_0738350 [marine sediment metagenome]|uniref:Uncharacterized protein n=1 Tax=marine sediment metagenome TaxID=412755 RepID=A0A0F9QBM1_9ZZZZ